MNKPKPAPGVRAGARLPIATSRPLRAAECELCSVRAGGPLRHATLADLTEVHARSMVRQHPKGDTVLREFGWGEGVACIRHGVAIARETDAEGNVNAVRLSSMGEMVGLETVCTRAPKGPRVSALSELSLCHIPRDTLLTVSDARPAVARGIIETLALQSGQLASERAAMQARTASGRVLSTVLRLQDAFGRVLAGEQLRLVLPFSRRELAELAGITPSTLSRTIAALESEGVASFEGRQVTIANLERARAVIEGRERKGRV